MSVLKRLVLNNFRNYQQLDIQFTKGVNVLVGKNGQGKTNLLEAIYFLSILRSFRCSKLRNLYRWRQPAFLIRGEVDNHGATSSIGIEYSQKRRLRVDGETINRASDFIGRLYTVAFVPEDIDLVKGAASERRRFLDITLSQLQPRYLMLLQAYDKALKSRNALLRHPNPDVASLQAFDRVMIPHGCEIIQYRLQFFAAFEPFLQEAAQALLPEQSDFLLKYQTIAGVENGMSHEDISERLAQLLQQNFERDQLRGVTHAGPHRDDFQLFLNAKNLSNFGSEGQCRLSAMILKLAKANYMFKHREEEEIILLVDDVIGELDERGCKAFFDSLQHADQVFVACTEEDKLHGLVPGKVFTITDGEIIEGGV